MKREFVYAENFEKCWKELKLSDKELLEKNNVLEEYEILTKA